MILGVPTLCRYDLLDELLRSVERGTLQPSRTIIVDNGGGYDAAHAKTISSGAVEVVVPGKNLGVAASWNRLMELAGGESVAISNDDILFAPDTFESLAFAVVDYPFAAADGFACFAITEECRKTVGWFDEHFYPAYFEDIDYHYRMRLSELRSTGAAPPESHGGSCTVRAVSTDMRQVIDRGYRENQAYYARKWGGAPNEETFRSPFNGNPPEGWRIR